MLKSGGIWEPDCIAIQTDSLLLRLPFRLHGRTSHTRTSRSDTSLDSGARKNRCCDGFRTPQKVRASGFRRESPRSRYVIDPLTRSAPLLHTLAGNSAVDKPLNRPPKSASLLETFSPVVC